MILQSVDYRDSSKAQTATYDVVVCATLATRFKFRGLDSVVLVRVVNDVSEYSCIVFLQQKITRALCFYNTSPPKNQVGNQEGHCELVSDWL